MLLMAKKDDQQTNVRIPAELKERITLAAEAAGRSFTAELVQRLEASFYSVLEATLLQARLTERNELLMAQADCEAAIEEVRKELDALPGTGDEVKAARKRATLQSELHDLQRQWDNIELYQGRLTADIKVLADKLQERMLFLEQQEGG